MGGFWPFQTQLLNLFWFDEQPECCQWDFYYFPNRDQVHSLSCIIDLESEKGFLISVLQPEISRFVKAS